MTHKTVMVFYGSNPIWELHKHLVYGVFSDGVVLVNQFTVVWYSVQKIKK